MSTKPSSVLDRAESMLYAGKYSDLITLLTPQVFLFRNDARYFMLLGLACLHTNDLGGAYSYSKRANDLDPNNVINQQCIAILQLRNMEEQAALSTFITILENNPSYEPALQAMDLIRLAPEKTDWALLGHNGSLRQIYPRLPWRFYFPVLSPKMKRIILFTSLAVIVSVFLIIFLAITFGQKQKNPIERPIPEAQTLNGNTNSPNFSEKFYLNAEEIRTILARLQDNFKSHYDNLVRIDINRILASNANLQTKNQVSLLITHLKAPNFTNYRGEIEFGSVQKEPYLYEGVYVKWSGKIRDIKTIDARLHFDFLLGYTDTTVLYGVIPAYLTFPAALKNEDSIEIIAKIVLTDSSSSGFSLEINTLRPLIN